MVIEVDTMSVEIPDELKAEVKKNPDVRWSEVVGRAIKHELEERAERRLILMALDKILENSTLTDEDCLRLGDELKERVWKRYQEAGW